MVRPARLVGALTLVLCTACGPEVPHPPAPVDDDLHWHADPEPTLWGWGLATRKHVGLALPEAEHATEDLDSGPWGRLVLNLLANGEVGLKGHGWSLESGVAEARRESLDELHELLARLLGDPSLRSSDGSCRVSVMLYVDREASWSTVRTLLSVLRRPDLGIHRLQLAVATPPRTFAAARRGVDSRIDLSMRALESAVRRVPSHDVQWRATRTGTRGEIELRWSDDLADRSWSFGDQGPGLEAPEVLRRANRIWAEVETWLRREDGGATAARIRVDDEGADLPWAYVVKTLDLLLGADIREVFLPDLDLGLILDEPEAPRSEELEDDPVVTPGILAGCALAVVLAFLITFLPRVRSRSRS